MEIIRCYVDAITNYDSKIRIRDVNPYEYRYVIGRIKCEAIAKTVSKPSWIESIPG